jgi:nitroimidazol reductase NimA-like FMN-containing flavoprotein (pyridoxamine 5'-phosphate oxidase superfamily)
MRSQDPTPRTEVRRKADRAHYTRDTIDAILDTALICHVGFVDDGTPVVLPTIHARVGDTLYFHGSPASRMLRHLKTGAEVCVTVTLIDGLVLARSAFNSSMNYRSAMVFGTARLVTDRDEKLAALREVTEHVIPGRWDEVRPITDKEMKATLVVALAIDEASAKVRTGPPHDEEDDEDLPIWAGVIPVETVAGVPVPDAASRDVLQEPGSVIRYRAGHAAES